MLRLFQRKPAPAPPAVLNVAHDGRLYRVALKRMANSRRFTLRVRAATRDVVLTMPARGSLKSAREFAERHAAWIGVRLARLPQPVAFVSGARIPLRGVEHLIAHRPQARGVVWTEAEFEPPMLCVAGELAFVARRIEDYLKREARKALGEAANRHAKAIGVAPSKIALRDTTSRWGSCSSTGGLNFSWRLILAPPFVLDYLAAHEVAHLRHMNHSPAFWRVTRGLFPETDKAEAWLRAHGAQLHRFGGETA